MGLFQFSDGDLILFLSLEEVVGSLFSEGVVAFLPVVDDLVHSDDGSLVLLRHVIGSDGLAASAWAE